MHNINVQKTQTPEITDFMQILNKLMKLTSLCLSSLSSKSLLIVIGDNTLDFMHLLYESICACSFIANQITIVNFPYSMFCFDMQGNMLQTLKQGIRNKKKILWTTRNATKHCVQSKRHPQKIRTHSQGNMFVPKAKLRKINYFHLQTHGLKQSDQLMSFVVILFDLISIQVKVYASKVNLRFVCKEGQIWLSMKI
jgi:hypothetical protein